MTHGVCANVTHGNAAGRIGGLESLVISHSNGCGTLCRVAVRELGRFSPIMPLADKVFTVSVCYGAVREHSCVTTLDFIHWMTINLSNVSFFYCNRK